MNKKIRNFALLGALTVTTQTLVVQAQPVMFQQEPKIEALFYDNGVFIQGYELEDVQSLQVSLTFDTAINKEEMVFERFPYNTDRYSVVDHQTLHLYMDNTTQALQSGNDLPIGFFTYDNYDEATQLESVAIKIIDEDFNTHEYDNFTRQIVEGSYPDDDSDDDTDTDWEDDSDDDTDTDGEDDSDEDSDEDTTDKEDEDSDEDATDKEDEVESLWQNPFKDVSEKDWYYEAVRYASLNNLFKGITEDTFEPHTQMSRAMIVSVLHRVTEPTVVPDDNQFVDVKPDAWYAPAIVWAAHEEILSGYGNGLFGPNDPLTREQLVTLLWRYDGRKPQTSNTLVEQFSDAHAVSGYATEAMQWAITEGIINGKTPTMLAPKDLVSRAETATLLMRFFENKDVK